MTYHVQGKLSPTNHEAAANENTREVIRRAAIRHSLTLAITDSRRGAITISGTFGFYGNQGARTFIKTLENFIQDETILELGLQGQLMIAEEYPDGLVPTPVKVKDGRVIQQRIFDVEAREVTLERV